ncbi:MAG TPA: ribonuclease HI [Dehalococcoidales bacterium]|nr:ribonuclease HI [Dehalococcoidales bacterium]
MIDTAHIQYIEQRMIITAAYHTDFVAELKSGTQSRKWDPENKAWMVDLKERAAALRVVKKFYAVVEENQPRQVPQLPTGLKNKLGKGPLDTEITPEWLSGGALEIWIDGACAGNPGPGGYGIIYKCRGQTRARSGGFRLTTNNRMEIMAAIVALETLPPQTGAVIYSDSQYLVEAINLGWAKRWRANNWKRNNKDKAINPDLWERLLKICETHSVEFRWVKGHDFQTENEWCDQLAQSAAGQPELPPDPGYQGENSQLHNGKAAPENKPRLL